MDLKENKGLVEVFAGNNWHTGIVKSLLENAGIETYLKDEIMGTFNPWWTAPGGAGAIKVFVSGRDFEEASIIVAEFEKNMELKH